MKEQWQKDLILNGKRNFTCVFPVNVNQITPMFYANARFMKKFGNPERVEFVIDGRQIIGVAINTENGFETRKVKRKPGAFIGFSEHFTEITGRLLADNNPVLYFSGNKVQSQKVYANGIREYYECIDVAN